MLWSSNVFAALNNVQTELQLSCGVLPGRFEAALSQEYLLALQAVINGDHAFGKARSACKAVLEDGAVLERIVEDYPVVFRCRVEKAQCLSDRFSNQVHCCSTRGLLLISFRSFFLW